MIDSIREINKFDYFYEGQAYTIRSPKQRETLKKQKSNYDYQQRAKMNRAASSHIVHKVMTMDDLPKNENDVQVMKKARKRYEFLKEAKI